jgi:Spy/CpxP family protein refolding chaperone
VKYALVLVMLLVAAAPTGVSGQQGSQDQARRAALEARRDSLEAEVLNRFVEELTRELRLDAEQRVRTERALRIGAQRRRDLMRASGDLRGDMIRALRNPATTDADFTRLLARHESLRIRESDLWTREQNELAMVLTPRQRTQFIFHWARFQDNVRDILAQQVRGGTPRH